MFKRLIDSIRKMFCWSVMDIKEGDVLKVEFKEEGSFCFVRKRVAKVFGVDEDWSGQKGMRVQFEKECVSVVITDNNDIYKITKE